MKGSILEQKVKGYMGVWCIFICCLLGVSGCASTNTEKEIKHKVVVICKGSQHEFWQTAKMGAEDACEELGVSMSFQAPQDESEIDVQVQMVEEAVSQKVDGILLAPLDSEKLNASIEKAVEAGIKVVTFDSDVSSKSRSSVIATSNEAAGAIAARNALPLLTKESTVAVIAHVKGSQTAEERKNGFLQEIQNASDKNITVLDTAYCDGDMERSRQAAKQFIQKNPEVKLIYATNEGGAVGAAQAVKELGQSGKIHIIGFDSSDEEIAYLDSGVIDGMMVQNPYNMGYLGIRNLYKIMNGEMTDERIDTGATYVDRKNRNDEDIQWLLYPMGK